MNTPITTKISTLALVCLLFGVGSCSREDDSQSGGKSLKVNVQMAASPMLARGATTSPIISDTMALAGDLKFVATSRPRDYEPQEALTRGTPIKSAANLPSLNVKVYNSGTASFSGSTALTATLKGTNSGGAWSLSSAYAIVDGVKNTYMAYSPIEDAGNGIAVATNGRTLTYTAPTTVANQPDLCTSTIVKDDVSSNLPLAMQHRLVAVGIKGMGNWVQINSIVLSNVYSSGTLDLETGAWSNLGTKTNFTPVTTQSSLSTNGAMNDITAANGYLMLPPQSFTDDNQTITVKYKYLKDAGSTEQTATYKLKNLAGGKWEAGQIVMYEIQLKASFSLTLNPASLTLGQGAGTASFTYSTNSPSTNDPQFTNGDASWITNLQVNRSTKTVTFNYAASNLSSDRKATIKATSGWTAVDYSVTQNGTPVITLSASSWSAGTGIGGQTKTINVNSSSGRWKIIDPGKDGKWSRVVLSRTEGANGESVTITIKGNPQKVTRNFDVRFEVVNFPTSVALCNIQQDAIKQYEVSNAHTQFVPSGLLNMAHQGNWMPKQEYDLFENKNDYRKTDDKWTSRTDGFLTNSNGYGDYTVRRYCRNTFGDRAFTPAIEEMPIWTKNTMPSGVNAQYGLRYYTPLTEDDKRVYIYMTSTYKLASNGLLTSEFVFTVGQLNGTVRVVKENSGGWCNYTYHRCFYKEDI